MIASTGPSAGGQPSHQHRGGQELAAHLGHHALGQRQPPGIGVPGRLERDGFGAVAAARQADGTGGGKAEAACGRSADEATEHRPTVEAGDAQPVDRPVRADQRGAAGVAEQGVVLDGDADGSVSPCEEWNITASPQRTPSRRPSAMP